MKQKSPTLFFSRRFSGNGIAGGALGLTLLASTSLPALAQSNEDLLHQLETLQKEMEVLKAQVQENKVAQQQTVETIQTVEKAVAAAPDKGIGSGHTGVELAISGQVNRGILAFDDGEKTDVLHVDNDNSSTRLRFTGKGNIDEEWSVGTQIEVQFESNSTASVNQENQRNVGVDSFTQRKLEFYVDHKDFGRVWLGQGDTASNGTAEQDLSGTDVVGYSGVSDLGGGLLFRNENDGTLSSISIGDAFSNLDGLSRDDRIRYDTPTFHGFKAAASLAADDRQDIAVFYNDTYDSIKVSGAAAAANISGELSRYDGSLSLLHLPSGISGTFAAGLDDFDESSRDERTFAYGKLGYQVHLFEIGKTALSVDYYRGDSQASNDDESNSAGFQFVQNIDKVGTELYIGTRWHEYEDDSATDYDDVLAVLAGGRVKF
ncbi:porin [Kiloniella laminariae]|uniref:porin n=1 Tax=Kiloniella laminariae TaxID=454162 RepID=UPI000361A065|nr:porin [Kiloniella laminariae]